MRHLFLTLLVFTLLTLSCKKTKTEFFIPEGTYTGTFQRLTSAGGPIANVTITFSENNWAGQGQYTKYPALCNGTYSAKGTDSIHFENACAWTAEFDGTLILAQDYKINFSGNDIEISRDYNGVAMDMYKLKKQ
jgi:hypothetical protein